MELLANVTMWCSCLSAIASPESVISAYFFMIIIVLKISYDTVFSTTFRLTQPLIEVSVKADILAMLEIRSDSMYREAGLGSLLALKRAVWIYVPLTALLPLSLWNLVNVRLMFALLVMAFRQLIGFAVAYRLNRIFLNQNVEFTMPLTYAMKEPSDEDKRNILHGLQSEDMLIQVLAFWDLKKLSVSDSVRRLSIYSLSQPGGHPRNWNAVKEACLKTVASVAKKIDEENSYLRVKDIQQLADHVILDPNAVKEGNIEIDRSAMMLPPELRLQMHRENIRLRREYALSGRRFNFLRQVPAIAKIEKVITAVIEYVAEKKKVVTDFEADQVHYAIESIRALAQHSYSEDRFGVVQKDLDQIFSSFLGLLNSAESNIRIKHLKSASAPVPDYVRHFNAGVLKIEQTATVAISRLANTFKEHINSLHLSDKEKELLGTLTQ
uniref:Nucleoporin n=1 Tax=Steinernema glaseri TaxID=37863 RepID=A0A1I7YJ17_9BILA